MSPVQHRSEGKTRTRATPWGGPRFSEKSGGVLLSQGVHPQVPSALTSLTSVFGMGTGVASSLSPPETGCDERRTSHRDLLLCECRVTSSTP